MAVIPSVSEESIACSAPTNPRSSTVMQSSPERSARSSQLASQIASLSAPSYSAAGPSEAAKLERAPTLVVVSAALSGDLVQDEEDVCATAAATMLVLLAATERGLASYWRTPGVLRTERGREAVIV